MEFLREMHQPAITFMFYVGIFVVIYAVWCNGVEHGKKSALD